MIKFFLKLCLILSIFFLLISKNSLANKNSFHFIANPDSIVYDTVIQYIYDTVYKERVKYIYDTIYLDDTENNYSVEPFFSYGSFNYIYKTDKERINYFNNKSSLEENNSNFLSYGVQINKPYKKLEISSGVGLTRFSKNVKYIVDVYNTENKEIEKIIDSYKIFKDTVDEYYQIVNNDTSYYYIINDILLPSKDTLKENIEDTLYYNNAYKGKQILTYFEIPIIIGYKIPLNINELFIRGGIINSFLIDSKGKLLSINNIINFIDLDANNLKPINFSYFFSGCYKVKVTDNIKCSVEIFYRNNFNSVLKSEIDERHKLSSINLKFGLVYNL